MGNFHGSLSRLVIRISRGYWNDSDFIGDLTLWFYHLCLVLGCAKKKYICIALLNIICPDEGLLEWTRRYPSSAFQQKIKEQPCLMQPQLSVWAEAHFPLLLPASKGNPL